VDLASSPLTEKKSKRKEQSKKHSSPCYLLKRSCHATSDAGMNVGGQLFTNDLVFFKSMNFSLSPVKKGAKNLAFTKKSTSTCLDMQSRALVFAKILLVELSMESVVELLKLKQKLANSASSLKTTLEANSVQNDQLIEVEVERDSSKTKREDLERKEKLMGDTRSLSIKSFHYDAVSEKVQLELDTVELNMLTVHYEGFNQVVHQSILLYGVLSKNEFDAGRDAYKGQLVPIKEITTSDLPMGKDTPTGGMSRILLGLFFVVSFSNNC